MNNTKFYNSPHCCGLGDLYIGFDSPDIFKKNLTDVVNANLNRAVLHCVLRWDQIKTHEQILLDFGFVKSWGPLKNPNSMNDICGYYLDCGAYKAGTLKKVEKPVFAKLVASVAVEQNTTKPNALRNVFSDFVYSEIESTRSKRPTLKPRKRLFKRRISVT